MNTVVQLLDSVELGNAAQARNSIIWLHGLGADGNDFVSLVPELGLPTLDKVHFVFPHAPVRPVTLNGGIAMRAWFDLYNLTEAGPFDEVGILESVAAIHQLIEREIAQGIKAENIILAGFSQGGYIALLGGLFYPERLGGIIGLSTFLWRTPSFDERRHPNNQKTPIFLAHGTYDSIVPLKYGEHSVAQLKNDGYEVSFHTYPMAHTVCLEEIETLSRWLQGRLR